jgi:peptidoglycan/LPS O-acetylase OafA/YrhL
MAQRIAGLGAAAILAAVAAFVLYAAAVDDDEDDGGNVAVFVIALGTAAALGAVGPFLRRRERRIGVIVTAAVLAAVLGAVTTFSVGPLLVPAVLLLLYAAFSG